MTVTEVQTATETPPCDVCGKPSDPNGKVKMAGEPTFLCDRHLKLFKKMNEKPSKANPDEGTPSTRGRKPKAGNGVTVRKKVSPSSALTDQMQKKIMRSSHGGNAGRSLIERIELQMDKRRAALEKLRVHQGVLTIRTFSRQSDTSKVELGFLDQTLEQGRYEGMAAALAILRSSSLTEEMHRSNERLGIGE